ncbi:hypothetical protein V6N00_12705 [Tersicoccus sp. MR15.9]|uniref:hypothetical protein n=1 Tax=Tersicoccus mangrovi TaxID=3121635 RepID=UPI002FE5B01C
MTAGRLEIELPARAVGRDAAVDLLPTDLPEIVVIDTHTLTDILDTEFLLELLERVLGTSKSRKLYLRGLTGHQAQGVYYALPFCELDVASAAARVKFIP